MQYVVVTVPIVVLEDLVKSGQQAGLDQKALLAHYRKVWPSVGEHLSAREVVASAVCDQLLTERVQIEALAQYDLHPLDRRSQQPSTGVQDWRMRTKVVVQVGEAVWKHSRRIARRQGIPVSDVRPSFLRLAIHTHRNDHFDPPPSPDDERRVVPTGGPVTDPTIVTRLMEALRMDPDLFEEVLAQLGKVPRAGPWEEVADVSSTPRFPPAWCRINRRAPHASVVQVETHVDGTTHLYIRGNHSLDHRVTSIEEGMHKADAFLLEKGWVFPPRVDP